MSDLPLGWSWARLVDLTTKIGSGATPRGGKSAYKASGVPLVRSMNIHFDGWKPDGLAFIDDQQAEALRAVEVQEQDVLLNITGASIGRVTTAPADLAGARVNQHVAIIRMCEGISPEYTSRYLASPDMQALIRNENYGMTRPALTKAMIEDFRVPLPPTSEQHRIVAKLDSLFARTRSAREELARIPRLIEHYKQAILAAAFRGELTADWRTEHTPVSLFADTAGIDGRSGTLPALPPQWSWTSMGAISAVCGGLTKNAKRRELADRVPYLRVANVYTDELRLDDVQEIGCTPQELKKTVLEPGDLLIVEGNGSVDQIGRVALWDGGISGCSHQNHLIRARPGSTVVPEFLLFWMLSPLGRQYIERVASSSSGLHTLSISKVSGLPVPLCSVEEMSKIALLVRRRLDDLTALAQERERATHLLDHLDQANLTKAFRGELVPQDPNDEPAAVLLERIRAARAAEPKPKRRRHKTASRANP